MTISAGPSADLAILAVGAPAIAANRCRPPGRMGVASWLESVLSWPRRFIVGYDSGAGRGDQVPVASGDRSAG